MKPRWGWPETSELRGDVVMTPVSTQCAHFDSAPPNTPVLTHRLTHSLGHLHVPPWRSSPGAGPMHGLGALVTGLTRATASLDTCPTTNRALRGQ